MGVILIILKVLGGLLGVALAVTGALALVFLVMVFVPDSSLASQSLGQVWFRHDPFLALFNNPSIQLAQVVIERKLNLPMLWNPGITTILNWPSWLALMSIAVVGMALGTLLWRLAVPTRRRSKVRV